MCLCCRSAPGVAAHVAIALFDDCDPHLPARHRVPARVGQHALPPAASHHHVLNHLCGKRLSWNARRLQRLAQRDERKRFLARIGRPCNSKRCKTTEEEGIVLSHGASSDSWCEPSLIGAICCILAKCQGNGGLACHVHQCRACGDRWCCSVIFLATLTMWITDNAYPLNHASEQRFACRRREHENCCTVARDERVRTLV